MINAIRRFCWAMWLVLALAISPEVQAQIRWDMATPYPDGNPHTRNVRQFVEDVEGVTSNALRISVHSNASLIKHPEIPRAVRVGTVQLGEVLLSSMGNENPLFAFDSIPGLTPGYPEAKRLWLIARPKVTQAMERLGLVPLYTVPWQPTGIFTNKELRSLADLKGTKFRTFSPATSRFAELFGAVPTSVQVPEVPQAFRTGLVDAMITSGATGIDTQAWDYLKYYYDTQTLLVLNIVFANRRELEKLAKEHQEAIRSAASKAEERGWARSEELTASLNQTMASKGIQIVPPSPQMKAEIQAIGAKMAEEWAAKAGADGAAILTEYRR